MTRHRSAVIRVVFALLTVSGCFEAHANGRAVHEAVEVARALRGSNNVYDQIAGAGTLVDIGDEESLWFLAEALQYREHSSRRSAIDTLLSVRNPAGVALILRTASREQRTDPGGYFMRFVVQSLASQPRAGLTDLLIRTLALGDGSLTKHALKALAGVPLGKHETRIREIADDESQGPVNRAYAHRVLLGTSDRDHSVAMLVRISTLGSPEAKEAAAVALGQVDSTVTRDALHDMHGETDPYVRLAVLASEAGLGVEDAMAGLVETIAHGPGLVGPAAAASLRRLPAAIARRISDDVLACCTLSMDVAARLIESWASIDAEPAKICEWGLHHDDPDVRLQTVWLVGQRGALQYLDVVIPMLRDADAAIRGMAAWTIVRLIGHEYVPGTEI